MALQVLSNDFNGVAVENYFPPFVGVGGYLGFSGSGSAIVYFSRYIHSITILNNTAGTLNADWSITTA